MNVKNLLEKRAGIWKQMQVIMAAPAGTDDQLDAEQARAWDAFETELQTVTGNIERAQRAAGLDSVDYGQVIETRGKGAGKESEDGADENGLTYRTVWQDWTRYGQAEMQTEARKLLRTGFEQLEKRAQGVASQAAGGYLVPPEFREKLVERMKFISSVRAVAEIITTETGADLPWPTNDDTANVGAILAENSAVTEQDITLGTATIGAYTYTSKMVRVSLQLMQDAYTDVEALLSRLLGNRLGRIQNQHFTTGTGTSQPQGLVTGGTAVQMAAGNTTSITYDALIDVMTAIDPAYMGTNGLQWMASQTALAVIRKLKDADGRPLWQPSIQLGAPDVLLGYGLVLNNDMAVPAANAKSMAFGDFKAGYLVRDVLGVQTVRLDERYAEYLQVAFLAFQRSSGGVQDANAYRVLQHSAT